MLLLRSIREAYFEEITRMIPEYGGHLIVLTHALPDRPEFLSALGKVLPISMVIAVPYSIDNQSLEVIKKKYHVVQPSLHQLSSKTYLQNALSKVVHNEPFAIVEIGGYFAPVVGHLREKYEELFLGVVEDTEAGCRRYESISPPVCPVVSVARSTLKQPEDALVGPSCLFSTEKILRETGFPLSAMTALVLGYGKIGKSVARALVSRNLPTIVYDHDPTKRILALAEGFAIPARKEALKNADIIFGATGNMSLSSKDLPLLKNGTILISCSSKEQEFDLVTLKAKYKRHQVAPNLDRFENEGQVVLLLAHGQPVNFVDNAVIGPVLALVQSEIIVALRRLQEVRCQKGIFEVAEETRRELARVWIKYFSRK